MLAVRRGMVEVDVWGGIGGRHGAYVWCIADGGVMGIPDTTNVL